MKIEIEMFNADAINEFDNALKKLRSGIIKVNFVSETGEIESHESFPETEYLIHSLMNDRPYRPVKKKKKKRNYKPKKK